MRNYYTANCLPNKINLISSDRHVLYMAAWLLFTTPSWFYLWKNAKIGDNIRFYNCYILQLHQA